VLKLILKVWLVGWLVLLPTVVHSQATVDKDNDGIPDAWETAGFVNITLPDGTVQKLDLTKDGPLSPDHKDIFVWIAWMEDATHTHKPSPTAIQIVKDSFAKAPVSNPDGKSGIRLHVYYSSVHIPEIPMLGTWHSDQYDWTAFDNIKKKFFPKELEHVFHFCVFAHDIDDDHHSGFADIGGYRLIVSLGAFGLDHVGDTQSQAGTFMHELGHNLGLRHGGADDINNKPNYLSVMNYFFQLDGLPINEEPANFDYSRFLLDADENHLDKASGLNVSSQLAIYGSQYFCARDSDHSETIDSIGRPIDWDCSGSLSGVVAADINGDGTLTALKGMDDWKTVHLTFPRAAQGIAPRAELKRRDELNLSAANRIALPPIAHVRVDRSAGTVKVWWKSTPLDRVVAYRVIRRSENGEQVELATVEKNNYVDVPPGKGAFSYFVTGLYVPFGNANKEQSGLPESLAARIIDDKAALADIVKSAPDRMQRMQTMGAKPGSHSTAALPQYLVETTVSAPASIVIQ
jgi:hypothetical protein